MRPPEAMTPDDVDVLAMPQTLQTGHEVDLSRVKGAREAEPVT